jgi:hypothetical protein
MIAAKPSSAGSGGHRELGAHARTDPPDHMIGAVLGRTVAGDTQQELVRHFVLAKSLDPDPSVGHVGNEAKAWFTAVRGLQFCQTFERVARRSALFIGLQRKHVCFPFAVASYSLATTATLKGQQLCIWPTSCGPIFRAFA